MSNDRFLNKFIFEQQQLLEDTNLLLKKFLFISLNETNNHLIDIIQKQNELFNNFIQEKDRDIIQKQTIENLLHQILSNENILINKLKRIYVKKKRRQKKNFLSRNRSEQIINQESSTMKLNTSNDQILKIYWRSISSNNLLKTSRFINIIKSSSSTHLDNNRNTYYNFTKLKKINRIH